MARILITGASGLLGLNLALEAAPQHEVLGLVHSHLLVDAPFATRQIDLLDEAALDPLLDEFKPEWLIHCVALANLDACEAQPELAQHLNADLPARLAQQAAQRGIRLLHISTDAVFDGQKGNYAEDDAPHPLSIYAATKLAGEEAVMAVDPDALVARVNFFGWSLAGSRSLAEFFYNKLSAGESVPGLTHRWFSPLLANDLGLLLMRMMELELAGLFHVASPVSLSKYDFGVAIAERFAFDPDLVMATESPSLAYAAPRAGNLTLNVDKLTAARGADLPDVHTGLNRLHALHREGYPDRLRAMAVERVH
ncbi:MAG: SDR family oxidoreductase [Chloroflexi bacterium]|nr:SDR family oxidoreductase [Chloroflexota bacterium]